ncbi:MAG TPA: DUF5700 domain-containing putative Zn-dependent protease [Gemmatimonadales bacterium]
MRRNPWPGGRVSLSSLIGKVAVALRPALFAITVGSVVPGAAQSPADRVQLRLDTVQAAAVLALVEGRPAAAPGAWQALFTSEGYRRLQTREAAMRRAFTDSSFAAFVRSDGLASRAPALRAALRAWAGADLQRAAARALAYLPADARIRATVYLVIKPQTNSFVWEVQTDPAIFLYLDPAVSPAQFENTVAHELHHIGFASVRARRDAALAALAPAARAAAGWMGAFGEGFAMLAAAGGPGVHPHADSPAEDRARWDRDVARFNQDLGTLEAFFGDILAGRLATPDTIQAVAANFYGIQGPWYTVGWKMAAVIEERFGRDELIRCMTDPRRLLRRYNDAAAPYDRAGRDSLALWSPGLLDALGVAEP